ncbi:MAG: hypothetical protein AAB839_00740 [Patescibacteria group bacterium]
MSDSRSPVPSSSSRTTPTDAELTEMGVDPSARGFIDALAVIVVGFLFAATWIKDRAVSGYRRFVAWNREDNRNLAITGLVTALLLVGFVAWGGNGSPPEPVAPPIATVTAPPPVGSKVMKAKFGDSYKGIAAANGLDWRDLVRANIQLVRTNTTWCNARPTSAFYRAGLLEDGKTPRNSTFCQIFTFDGEELAVETLREHQDVIVPAPTVALAATAAQPE